MSRSLTLAFATAAALMATLAGAAPVPGEKVVVPTARIVLTAKAFSPGDPVGGSVSFRQDTFLTNNTAVPCFDTSHPPMPCVFNESLALRFTPLDSAGTEIKGAARESLIGYAPPPFYTAVQRTFAPIAAPQTDSNGRLRVDLVFYDQSAGPTKDGGRQVMTVPKVLGSLTYRIACRPTPNHTGRCRYSPA